MSWYYGHSKHYTVSAEGMVIMCCPGVVGERSDGADMQPELLTDTPSTATPDKPLSKFRQRRMQA